MNTYEHYIAGDFKVAIEKKAIDEKIELYCRMMYDFKRLRKTYNYRDAIHETAELWCTSERTIRRAISRVTK